MVRVLQGIPIFTSRPISPVSLFWSCTLVEIELMISLFSLFEVMEPQGNYIRSFTTRVRANSHGCFVVTFPVLHVYFIYIKHTYFTTLMKCILELLELSFAKMCID
jgi:hypothetical protein